MASTGCRKRERVPVLFSVATTFRATMPAFTMVDQIYHFLETLIQAIHHGQNAISLNLKDLLRLL
jgi:hypothetical protein